MKTLIKIIIVAICILTNTNSFAQRQRFTAAEQQEEELKTLQNTPYIFEGIVTSQESDQGTLTGSIVQINKIFRGSPQIELGSIKIMTLQSTMDGGIMRIDDGVGIFKGIKYLFFCDTIKESNWLPIKKTITDNSLIFRGAQFIRFNEENHKKYPSHSPVASWVNGAGTHVFNEIEDLYTYLRENGLYVQVEAQPVKK